MINYRGYIVTEANISHFPDNRRADWRVIIAVLGVLGLLQILLVSVYFEYTAGYFITSLLLGVAGYFLFKVMKRSLKATGNPVGYSKVLSSHIGNDLFDDLPVPMIDTDQSGEIRQVNAAACALIGRSDLVGAHLDSVVEGLGRSIKDRIADTMKGFGGGRPEMARCNRIKNA